MKRTDPGSWTPVDLADVLSGNYEAPEPKICRRSDGRSLFYPGRTHSVASEPEAGKTWLALLACSQEILAGRNVVYVDFEDDAAGIVGRLRCMGCSDENIRKHFSYLRPSEPIEHQAEDFFARVVDTQPSLVVIDGVTEAMVNEGLSLISNDDVAEFHSRLARPLADCGAAVVSLDHVVKKRQDQARTAIGGIHKLAAISGAAYKLEGGEPFAVGRTGRSHLSVTKDRPGQVRRQASDASAITPVGVLVVSSSADGFVNVDLLAPSKQRTDGAAAGEERVKRKILDIMGQEEFRVKEDLRRLVGVQSQTFTDALRSLISEGKVSEQPPYRVIR